MQTVETQIRCRILHCLPITLLRVSRLQWVKCHIYSHLMFATFPSFCSCCKKKKKKKKKAGLLSCISCRWPVVVFCLFFFCTYTVVVYGKELTCPNILDICCTKVFFHPKVFFFYFFMKTYVVVFFRKALLRLF